MVAGEYLVKINKCQNFSVFLGGHEETVALSGQSFAARTIAREISTGGLAAGIVVVP